MAAAQLYHGDFGAANEFLINAEEIARKANLRRELSRTLETQGWCQFNMGNIDPAMKLGEQALALSEEEHFAIQIARSLNLLTAIHATLGRYEQASQECERALSIFKEIGDRIETMFQMSNLGLLCGLRGDHDAALRHFQDALAHAREMGRRNAEMIYLNNLGGGYIAVGEYLTAEENLRRVIEMSETTRFSHLYETYCLLADALLGQGKPDVALEAIQRSFELGRKNESPEFMVVAWRVLGKIAAGLGQAVSLPDRDGQSASYTAEACFAESDRICRETGMEGERAHTLRAWANYELERGDQARGMTLWNEAREIFERIGATLEATRMADLPAQHSS
jgi:tetratricopeptide (TPR) repeat protein